METAISFFQGWYRYYAIRQWKIKLKQSDCITWYILTPTIMTIWHPILWTAKCWVTLFGVGIALSYPKTQPLINEICWNWVQLTQPLINQLGLRRRRLPLAKQEMIPIRDFLSWFICNGQASPNLFPLLPTNERRLLLWLRQSGEVAWVVPKPLTIMIQVGMTVYFLLELFPLVSIHHILFLALDRYHHHSLYIFVQFPTFFWMTDRQTYTLHPRIYWSLSSP